MNAADILGELLRGGKGGGLLKDLFNQAAPPEPKRDMPAEPRPGDIAREAKELEDMIGVGRGGAPRPAPRQPQVTREDPAAKRVPPPLPDAAPDDPDRQDAEATVLIRAMVLAAKADGRLSPEEQQALIGQMGGASPEVIRFLQDELNRELTVRDFSWSVPLGLETKVYMMALTAATVDTREESAFLDELAHGLRLPGEIRRHIHRQLGLA